MNSFNIFKPDSSTKINIPFFPMVTAGFPSPAADYKEQPIDLNRELIRNKAATFMVRVDGTSMEDANIYHEDVLIIDRSLTAKDNDIIIAALNGEFTVKRFIKKGNCGYLIPENKAFKPIKVTADDDFCIWGVVTYVIHKIR